MHSTEIQKQMLKMFVHMRIAVGVLGIAFPIVLIGGGKLQHIQTTGSLSAYYHATCDCSTPKEESLGTNCIAGAGPMRNWFVGTLFCIGIAMFALKGFSRWEDWLLSLAGVFAPCIALCPMLWPDTAQTQWFNRLHGPSAILFFLCIATTVLFCSEKTLHEMPDDKKQFVPFYRWLYRLFAALMLLAPLAAALIVTWQHKTNYMTIALEIAGIEAFGAYWICKTIELWQSDVEGRAFRGELKMDTKKWQ